MRASLRGLTNGVKILLDRGASIETKATVRGPLPQIYAIAPILAISLSTHYSSHNNR
jgi:hypothetical protein